ncbi:hypothetical protein [Desulfitobacterium metallireducens]|uniref:50S ribosomal protein L29 n=1 Tax=Desulfitobacterium metallireducens DSM 15288 TaxID=871968 RepID=W0EBY7_9FIRM|nr:hypothetical protein [Desulfitobacterium metallireducens]AHF06586.1 hypothetical protein DESME_05585 [Desulfitobacterium metallireducens DSM 15288]
MNDLTKLSLADLKRRLQTLEEEREELEEEKNYVLRQTGLHISAVKAQKYQSESEALAQSIAEIKAELAKRG